MYCNVMWIVTARREEGRLLGAWQRSAGRAAEIPRQPVQVRQRQHSWCHNQEYSAVHRQRGIPTSSHRQGRHRYYPLCHWCQFKFILEVNNRGDESPGRGADSRSAGAHRRLHHPQCRGL